MSGLGVAFVDYMDTVQDHDVHRSRLPKEPTLPCYVYALVPSEGPLVSHDGDTGTAVARIQLDCWGTTPDQAEDLADAARVHLSAYTGPWGDLHIDHCLLDNVGQDDDDARTGLYRRIVDLVVQYNGGDMAS